MCDEQKKYRCKNCSYPLFFATLIEAVISKDCKRCGERNLITVTKTAGASLERIELIKK